MNRMWTSNIQNQYPLLEKGESVRPICRVPGRRAVFKNPRCQEQEAAFTSQGEQILEVFLGDPFGTRIPQEIVSVNFVASDLIDTRSLQSRKRPKSSEMQNQKCHKASIKPSKSSKISWWQAANLSEELSHLFLITASLEKLGSVLQQWAGRELGFRTNVEAWKLTIHLGDSGYSAQIEIDLQTSKILENHNFWQRDWVPKRGTTELPNSWVLTTLPIDGWPKSQWHTPFSTTGCCRCSKRNNGSEHHNITKQ